MNYVLYDLDQIFGEMYYVDGGTPSTKCTPRFSMRLSKAQRFPNARAAYEFAGRVPSMHRCRVGHRLPRPISVNLRGNLR